MENRYIIQWKSKVNGRIGRGSKSFTRQEGEHLVAELNREYPEIEHELLTAPSEGLPAGQFDSRPQVVNVSQPAVGAGGDEAAASPVPEQTPQAPRPEGEDDNSRALSA